jgi:hypothetical protein
MSSQAFAASFALMASKISLALARFSVSMVERMAITAEPTQTVMMMGVFHADSFLLC